MPVTTTVITQVQGIARGIGAAVNMSAKGSSAAFPQGV
tara:strand:+ start:521 stop:634 length:114 start_codon:yes stop_codon:yes gene_type:complete